MSEGIGPGVKIVVVLRFVDSYTPENDRRMVPIPADHATHVVYVKLLPRFVPHVLPARNISEDEQGDLVTGIEKMPGLWVVRRSDDIALKLLAKDLRVAALNAPWHRLTDPREGLMPIKPA